MAFTPSLTYKGRPLVRCGNDIYYGSMHDPYVVYLQVLTTKKEGNADVADKVHIVLLSTDEITLALFDQHIGEKHDEIVERTQAYLMNKALEIISCGISVILDWGFWQKEDRDAARAFFSAHGVPCEFHYLNISDEIWQQRLAKRNAAILAHETSAYYVDEGLAKKFGGLLEPPDREEMDVWLTE